MALYYTEGFFLTSCSPFWASWAAVAQANHLDSLGLRVDVLDLQAADFQIETKVCSLQNCPFQISQISVHFSGNSQLFF